MSAISSLSEWTLNSFALKNWTKKKKNQIIGVDFLFEVFNDTDIKPLSFHCMKL